MNQAIDLLIEALRRSHPNATDYWDGNWIHCTIEVTVGGFRGRVDADLRSTDFVSFRKGLEAVYSQLNGEASLETMEGWIALRLAGNGRGHFALDCELLDQPGFGNRLRFRLPPLDQTELPPCVEALRRIEAAFPVAGSAGT